MVTVKPFHCPPLTIGPIEQGQDQQSNVKFDDPALTAQWNGGQKFSSATLFLYCALYSLVLNKQQFTLNISTTATNAGPAWAELRLGPRRLSQPVDPLTASSREGIRHKTAQHSKLIATRKPSFCRVLQNKNATSRHLSVCLLKCKFGAGLPRSPVLVVSQQRRCHPDRQ